MTKDDWNDLSAVWQEMETDIDIAALTKNMHWKTLWTKVNFALETGGCLLGLGVGMRWIVMSEGDLARAGLGAVFACCCAMWIYFAWWTRKGAWHAASASPVDELRFVRARAVSGIKYAVVNLWSLPVCLLIVAYALWYVWQATSVDPIGVEPMVFLGGIPILYLTSVGIWARWYKRKKQAELEALDKVISEIEE